MNKDLDSELEESQFKIKPHYYFLSRKGNKPPYSPSYGLNSIIAVI